MRRANAAAASAGILLAACVTEPVAETADGRALEDRTEAPDPGVLSGYDIPAGSCGMILWSKNGSRVDPVFRSLNVTAATMSIEGERVAMLLQSQDGQLRLGMRQRQVFASEEGAEPAVVVTANLQWGEVFPGGTYVRSGSLTVDGDDGWSRILPVAGIAGCKA